MASDRPVCCRCRTRDLNGLRRAASNTLRAIAAIGTTLALIAGAVIACAVIAGDLIAGALIVSALSP